MNEEAWLTIFDANLDIVWAIVGDIYDVVKAEEDKERGIRAMGRRPARRGVSLDEVWATVFPPSYSMEAFPVALKGLMAGRSQRQFAAKVPCNQSTLSRLMSGEAKPDMRMMERIAEAAKIHPAYFLEWRGLWVSGLINHVFHERPHLSVQAVRKIRTARRKAA